jgi:pyruvate dehydrogenase E2 component (dihydrolipoamide acetyltransferase)
VQEGQSFAAGDIIANVETDKATMGWESQDDGIMAKIILPAGSQDIEVGTLVALTVDDESELEAAKNYSPGSSAAATPTAAAPASEAPAPAAPKASASSFPSHQVWTMPALSPTMTQGNIAKWYKKVGDPVAPGDGIVEVETDKATMMWESVDEGFVANILAPDGTQDIMVRFF